MLRIILSLAVFLCGTVYYAVQEGSNIQVYGVNPLVWPFNESYLWGQDFFILKRFYLILIYRQSVVKLVSDPFTVLHTGWLQRL